jgi:hypothetical protein
MKAEIQYFIEIIDSLTRYCQSNQTALTKRSQNKIPGTQNNINPN